MADPDRSRVVDAATLSAYRLGALAARLTPGPLASVAASSLGLGASFASPARREMFQRHLRRVNPHMGRAAMRVATQAVQVLGGAGYTRDFPVERYFREAKVLQIVEGTNQIQRMVIGRSLLTAP